jgi:hypothetical protein
MIVPVFGMINPLNPNRFPKQDDEKEPSGSFFELAGP